MCELLAILLLLLLPDPPALLPPTQLLLLLQLPVLRGLLLLLPAPVVSAGHDGPGALSGPGVTWV
jgi:hypothetical protein